MRRFVETSCVGRAPTHSSQTRYVSNALYTITNIDLDSLLISPIIASCPLYPHLLVQKMDLGACPKSHTERLKTEYLAAKAANPSDPTFSRFQKEYEANIFQFVDECDRRIRAAHRRLEKTPEENAKTTNLVSVRRSPDRHGSKKRRSGMAYIKRLSGTA